MDIKVGSQWSRSTQVLCGGDDLIGRLKTWTFEDMHVFHAYVCLRVMHAVFLKHVHKLIKGVDFEEVANSNLIYACALCMHIKESHTPQTRATSNK